MSDHTAYLDTYIKNLNNDYMSIEEQKTATVDKLIETNLRYVVSVAHQYKNMGLTLDDLIQEGNVGLVEASHKFDRTVDTKFITFAVHYIKMRIRNALTKRNSIVKQSNAHINKVTKIDKVINEFTDKTGREPSISEIATITEMSERVVQNAIGNKTNGIISINAELNAHEGNSDTFEKIMNIGEMVNGYTILTDTEKVQCLYGCIEQLSFREKFVITNRFMKGRTLQEIGNELNDMTPAGVKSIETRSISKLKSLLQKY